MADIFDELRDDLRAERAQNLLRRYGALLIVAAILVIVGVAGWQFWVSYQRKQTNEVASLFLDAMKKAADPQAGSPGATPMRDQAEAEFAKVAATGPEGYRTLARFREAALRLSGGDTPGALKLWDDVGNDPKSDPLLRDLAALLWAQSQVDKGEPAAIESHLAAIVAPGNPWRPLGLEAQALLSLRTGQDARARDLLKQLTTDPLAPDGVRARAGGLLSRMGDAPAVGGVGG